MGTFASCCVYTMRHSVVLDAQATPSGSHTLIERKVWKAGHLLWTQAEQLGERMALVFSGAEEDTGLIYWATIDETRIDDHAGTTACSYSNLRPVAPPRPKSSLRLWVGNRPLSEDFIRPYAICFTPDFLV